MRNRFVLALVACLALGASSPAEAGRQTLFSDTLAIKSLTVQSLRFQVPGEWMIHPRLEGHLDVSGGGRKDIEVVVLHDRDIEAFEKRRDFTPIHRSERGSAIDLDVPLPGPGAYALGFSNRFSLLSAKTVTGEVSLVWDEDPSLPTGEALLERVKFVELEPSPASFEVHVASESCSTVVSFERAGREAEPVYRVTVRRAIGDQAVQRAVLEHPASLDQVGLVDMHGDGESDVFLVGTAGPDSARVLSLVCPRQLAILSLTLEQPAGGGPVRARDYSASFGEPRYSSEQSFLERIKSAYGAP